jgi:putative hydrolase of the HAD superfamily
MGCLWEAVGFDLDYTLWDQDAFARSFFDAVAGEFGRRLGRGAGAVARALHGAMDRLTLAHPALFDQALHQLGAWDPRLVAELVERYHAHRPPAEPYPGARSTLDQLRAAGFRLFLVTDGHGPAQRHKLEALGLGDRFAAMVFTGELPGRQAKPSPLPFMLACDRLGLGPDRCIYVGDNPACDVPGARSLGMLTIGVGTGPYAARDPDPHPQPHLRIGHVAELTDLLLPAADGVRSLP